MTHMNTHELDRGMNFMIYVIHLSMVRSRHVVFAYMYGIRQKECNERAAVAYRAPRLSLCVRRTFKCTIAESVPSCKAPQSKFSKDCSTFPVKTQGTFRRIAVRWQKSRCVWQKKNTVIHFPQKSGGKP